MTTPPTSPARLALVGAGLIGTDVHLPRLVRRTDVEVVAIVDADADRARAVAERFGVPRHTTDLDAVLDDAGVDVIDLCTPPTLHRPQVHAALDAGKDVILEKPLATTFEDATAVAARAAASPERTMMVAENWVYSSAGSALRSLVEDGALGDIQLWSSRHESDHRLPKGGQPGWNYDLRGSGGGYLMQAGTHAVSLGRSLFGEIEWVDATSPQASGDGDPFLDHELAAVVGFRSGVIGSLTLTGRSHRAGARVLRQAVFGTDGTVDADILSGEVTVAGLRFEPPGEVSMGFDEEFDHFLACRRDGRTPRTSAADQLETLRTVTAMYRSAATGARVTVGSIA
ncbi:Gfo/Idh/MocA family protein [Agromyces sp. SYSU T0242]|uniref:Gfo/Idh/MocA family protein n=1 Tax=Agromyces litoreus TaxID=3158561 RepID=UPI00339896D5